MRLKRRICRILTLMMLCLFLLPALGGGQAEQARQADQTESQIVRVGWYESAFHRTDPFGRKSGYGYEYQQRLAIYTGWTYEYVEGSWPELLEMLIAGDIDLLTDVSYTPERAEKLLYSAKAMGAESYHVFITPGNSEIRAEDYSSLDGKRVGDNKNSIQEQLFIAWAESHGVHPEVIESTERTPAQLEMLARGEFDALVTLDTYGNSAEIVPVWNVGYAESFFGINRNRPDLKQQLDLAMNRLMEENRDYNQQMTERFNPASSVTSFLTTEEKEWLKGHGTIRIGYRDDFLPYCGTDGNGRAIGLVGDFMRSAKRSMKNADLRFETRAFASTEEAMAALKAGEIDCVFPLCLSSYDGEQQGVIVTDPIVSTMMYMLVPQANYQGLTADGEGTVALLRGHLSHETFLKDYFPQWKIVYYETSDDCFRAVSTGEADYTPVSSYRINRVEELTEKYRLVHAPTGKPMNMSFTLRKGEDSLYSILNKAIRAMPEAEINSSLTSYGFEEKKITFIGFLRDNLQNFIAVTALVTAVILGLVLNNVRARSKAAKNRQIISETERDPLTGLYPWNFFLFYANKIRREHPGKAMDAVAIDIDRFHAVNALHGREFGDSVLKTLSGEIQDLLTQSEGVACRSGADRFYIYCAHREDWQAVSERFLERIGSLRRNVNIHLRMGVKPWQEGMDPVAQFDRARIACNKARGDYNNRAIIFDAEMESREARDQRLLNDLGRALEQDEIEVYYQPKYNIQTPKPTLSSAEALVRWNHPELGLINPDDFIPLFERSGQITKLDQFVWARAAAQIAEWKQKYGITLPVSVNLSRIDIFDPGLADTLDELISRNGLDRKDLKLEVTESAYTENAHQLIGVIEGLRKRGYEIEMDDFGSGYSSLNMLSAMPVDILKMDIAFIRNIERNEQDMRFVELIIDIARNLKVPVVAEGVENVVQMELLKNAGCDLVQGYYFSRPLPADEFEKEIIEGPKRRERAAVEQKRRERT